MFFLRPRNFGDKSSGLSSSVISSIKKAKSPSIRIRHLESLLWFGPALLVIAAFIVYPVVYALIISFHKWNLTMPAMGKQFVGVENFIKLIKDDVFHEALSNTFIVVACSVCVQFILGISLALVMNQKLPGIRLSRAVLIAPTMVAPVVAGLIWRYMYFPGYGVISYFLELFGVSIDSGILATHGTALIAIIITDIWQWTPFVVLVTLAGLQGLPNEPVEAAKMDGATSRQIFQYITLPMIKPVLFITLLIRMVDTIKIFDPIYALTRGGPGNSTMTATFYAYEKGLKNFEMGYAAAITFFILFMVVVLSQLFIRVVYRNEKI